MLKLVGKNQFQSPTGISYEVSPWMLPAVPTSESSPISSEECAPIVDVRMRVPSSYLMEQKYTQCRMNKSVMGRTPNEMLSKENIIGYLYLFVPFKPHLVQTVAAISCNTYICSSGNWSWSGGRITFIPVRA